MDEALPDPALTLTLPSIHDGTPLDCRIYLPPSILAVATGGSSSSNARLPRWRGHAAIVAHPYAPMGGSYNDPIVKMVTQTLLSSTSSFVVATFNFRGAGRKPQGRTSWTAKPETGDYMTIAGFLYYFAHYLDPYGEKELARVGPTSVPPSTPPSPTLLFAGYSYGAMVTTLLPPLAAILANFVRPLRGSPAAEVRLRAARWAAIQNADFAAAASAAASSPAKTSPTKARRGEARLSMGVRTGGTDDDSWRRKSHEVSGGSAGGSMRHILTSPTSPRRSLSGDHRGHGHGRSSSGNGHANSHVRSHSGNEAHSDGESSGRGVSGLLARVRHSTHKDEPAVEDDAKSSTLSAVTGLVAARPAYLLVSPPVGLATSLATMSFGAAAAASGGGFFKRKRAPPPTDETLADVAHGDGKDDVAVVTDRAISSPDTNDKFACNPSLVVYGDADGFVSLKKMRTWAAGLTASSAIVSQASPAAKQPLFHALEVPTAGHFWAEGRTYYELQEAIGKFAVDLTEGVKPDGEASTPKTL
ncbi:hypothetical protein Sste5346_009024 [Sporothrix stenoceras]|uniref:Acid phosphatase n=1 Tax=Sporothrix stenoceras TaxID=5173 RepID=A0ABR3YLQ4_9PEZI